MLIGVAGRAEAHLAEDRGGGSETRMLGGAAEGQQGAEGLQASEAHKTRRGSAKTTRNHETLRSR